MLKAVLIATSLAVATPSFAQQVRVITRDIEHVYGPGAELLDGAELQARNQRFWEHNQAERQLAVTAGTAQNSYSGMAPEWGLDGGWFIDSTGRFAPRVVVSRR